MSIFAPSVQVLHPSMMLPEIAMQYSMASGAFELLPGGSPEVKIGSNDLMVYQKYLRMTTQSAISQSMPNQIPSSSVVPGYTNMQTYRIVTRSQYGLFDSEAASAWGYSLTSALQLSARQALAQQLRTLLLYGQDASNHEGIVNTPGATAETLGTDSHGNATLTTWDPGELALFVLGLFSALKVRMMSVGQPTGIVVLAPQRIIAMLEWLKIVQLTSYQRPGAGTETSAGVIRNITEGNGSTVMFAPDDTLVGKGAGGTDLIIISAPVINVPSYNSSVNTNVFSSLTPNQTASNMMFCDVAAPTEVSTPVPDGALTTVYTMRSTPGWTLRAEGLTLLSVQYE